MKIESVLCDLHPGQRLVQTDFKIASRLTFPDEKALRCTRPECSRYYHYDFGYFHYTLKEQPDFGNLAEKPSCRLKHDLLYMLLTKVDGEVMYACFHPESPTTKPYETS